MFDRGNTELTQRLSGAWDVIPTPLNSCVAPRELPDAGWVKIPECAHLQVALYPDQPYWGNNLREINHSAWFYKRSFVAPLATYKRARLVFEGVDYYASIWLNGHYVGQHEGHFTPFAFDVTGLVRPGAENVLHIRVTAPWDARNPRGTYPTDHVIRGLVKGLYEHGEGVIPPDVNPIGIWRPVWLVLDDGISVEHTRIETDLDGRISIRLAVLNATGFTWHGQLDLAVEGETHDGPGCRETSELLLPPGLQHIETTLKLAEPTLWWPWDHGDAALYRLNIRLSDPQREAASAASTHFGIRTVRLERTPNRFTYYVNERPVALRGTSYMSGLYLSQVTAGDLLRDIGLVRAANLNLMRVHVHIAPRELYDLCDRAGMMVWQDFELNWVQDPSPAFEARARALQGKMIDQLFNHPSVITWTCHNEPTMVFLRRHNLEQRPDPALYADALEQDSTRPVFICSGQLEDDWQRSGDVHSYYGAIWSQRYTDIYPQRYRLNTEFGFETPAALETLMSYTETWQRLQHLEGEIEQLWAYQAALIQYHVEHLRRLRADGCAGYVHFWLADLVPQVGCGVLDARREPKSGYDALRRASQPLHVALEHDGTRPHAIWVFNDTTTVYPNAVVEWRVSESAGCNLVSGSVTVGIAANTAQRVTDVTWSVTANQCYRVELTLRDNCGAQLASNFYERPFQPLRRPRGYPWKFNHYLGTKVFDLGDAPSLADQGASPLVRLVPLRIREQIAERALRQRLPTRVVSVAARLLDALLG